MLLIDKYLRIYTWGGVPSARIFDSCLQIFSYKAFDIVVLFNHFSRFSMALMDPSISEPTVLDDLSMPKSPAIAYSPAWRPTAFTEALPQTSRAHDQILSTPARVQYRTSPHLSNPIEAESPPTPETLIRSQPTTPNCSTRRSTQPERTPDHMATPSPPQKNRPKNSRVVSSSSLFYYFKEPITYGVPAIGEGSNPDAARCFIEHTAACDKLSMQKPWHRGSYRYFFYAAIVIGTYFALIGLPLWHGVVYSLW